MDSATSIKTTEELKQAEIRKQIALLQAQLDNDHTPDIQLTLSPKRKRQSHTVLVPETPSKKKKTSARQEPETRKGPTTSFSVKTIPKSLPKAGPSFPLPRAQEMQTPTPSSSVLQKLAQAHKQKNAATDQEASTTTRSIAFTAQPPPPDLNPTRREEDLTLIEDLPLGPAEHKPPFDDPHFEKLEPNSGIRLSSRVLSHEDFQDHLRGRYYLSPSKLYSVVRLLPNKQGYDVPVSGDWVTIAVVAERGPMRYTKAPVGITHNDKLTPGGDQERMDELPSLDAQAGPSRPPPFQRRAKRQEETPKQGGKKYVNIRLIDFGCRSRGTSADGGTAKIRGDAYLSLLLFESDACDVVSKADGTKEKVYKGGSRGAFERISKLKEGAVIALLNPKILKPFQRSSDKPHPTDNTLALTPESDASIAVIGYSQDLGMCKAMKRDGTRCTSWCDKRVSEVCDYHVQNAIERRRAARPEFAVGTSGMGKSAKPSKQREYDPGKQWGLKPESQTPGATYVFSGHIVSGSDSRTMYIGENMGREAQAKAARKVAAADADKVLQKLLSRDKEGTKALNAAREFSKRQAAVSAQDTKGKARGKGKVSAKTAAKEISLARDAAKANDDQQQRKSAYSVELIKQLGFDPTAKDGKGAKNASAQSKLEALAALTANRKIELGPHPGKKQSCVRQPFSNKTDLPTMTDADDDRVNYAEDADSPLAFPDSDNDLEDEERVAFGSPVGLTEEALIDLDDSDDD